MGGYAIFCPSCDELILAAPECPGCSWRRPSDSAGVGKAVSDWVRLPVTPANGSRLLPGHNRFWMAGLEGDHGVLLSASQVGSATRVHALPPGYLIPDLYAASGLVLYHHGEVSTIPQRGKTLYARDCRSGSPVWEYRLPEAFTISPIGGNDDTVCLVTDAGECHLLDVQHGTPLRTPFFVPPDVRFAPLVHSGYVITCGGLTHMGKPALGGVDIETGRSVWRFDIGEPVSQPPIRWRQTVCIALLSGFQCLDLKNGEPLWTAAYRPPRLTGSGPLTCPPAMDDRLVIFGCGDRIEDRPGYALQALEINSGRSLWKSPLAHKLSLRPLIVGSSAMCLDTAGELIAIDLESGRRLWSVQAPHRCTVIPAVLEDHIVVVDREGELAYIRYRPPGTPPARPPEAYEALLDWSQAGIAHALRGDLSEAGRCFLAAGDVRHALKLYEKASDTPGIARCYQALHEWGRAIQIYRDRGDWKNEAETHRLAGQFEAAAHCFETGGDLLLAGEAFVQAEKMIDAARCFSTAKRPDRLRALAQGTLDAELADWLADSPEWQSAVDIYLRRKDPAAAARLCERRADLRQAFEIWCQAENWERGRALAQEMRDKRLEAEICLQQKQYGEAARLYEELNLWEEALHYYEQAKMFEPTVRALAGLGHFEEAARRLEARARHEEAAFYYRKSAEQAFGEQPETPEKAADYWRKAAENYALEGLKAEAYACHQEAARLLRQPLLTLTAVRIDSVLMVGQKSQFDFTITNNGFGPARLVRALIDGRDFGFDQPAQVGNRLDALAKGQSETIRAGLKPTVYGNGVEIRLELEYVTAQSVPEKVGPFQAFVTVQDQEKAGPTTTIHIGSFDYIGPGGVHAQDAVMVRPSYTVSNSEDLGAITNGIHSVIRKGLDAGHLSETNE